MPQSPEIPGQPEEDEDEPPPAELRSLMAHAILHGVARAAIDAEGREARRAELANLTFCAKSLIGKRHAFMIAVALAGEFHQPTGEPLTAAALEVANAAAKSPGWRAARIEALLGRGVTRASIGWLEMVAETHESEGWIVHACHAAAAAKRLAGGSDALARALLSCALVGVVADVEGSAADAEALALLAQSAAPMRAALMLGAQGVQSLFENAMAVDAQMRRLIAQA